MVRTKNPESSRCWDWVWIEVLSHWMTLWTVSWPLFASAIQQYHWGKGRTSLNTTCHAQTLQAKLENSKISMLMWKHFLNDSPVTFHFFLKVREWPGSQWGTQIISFVLAGWAPLTLYLQNIRVGLPKISTALKKKKNNASVGKTESTGRSTCVCWEQLYTGCCRSFHGVYTRLLPSWAHLIGKDRKGSKMHHSSYQWKTIISHQCFPKTHCYAQTLISSLKVPGISCSLPVFLDLHTPVDSCTCNS